jgi:hypothetical protein
MFRRGALSGFGIMVAAGLAELTARQIAEAQLPEYAASFSLARYADPQYVAEVAAVSETGQL